MRKLTAILTMVVILCSASLLCGCESLKPLLKTTNISNMDKNTDSVSDSEENSEDKSVEKENNEVDQQVSKYSIKDFYPFKENIKYIYEDKGKDSSTSSVYIDYLKGDTIQLRFTSNGTSKVKVLEYKNEELKIINSKSECNFREDLTAKHEENEEILLKEPLVKGSSWTLPDGRKRYISNTEVSITTPYGSLKALEVTTENNDSKDTDYYALNIGLVKTVYHLNGKELSSSISKLQENTTLQQNIKFYFPDVKNNKIFYSTRTISFKTNDITKMYIEKNFKDVPKELGKLLGQDAKIKSLYLGKDNIVYVDFSKELTAEMNAGSGYENMILQCIANTLGNYYNTDKVYITIENAPYSSGHIVMKKGETFSVNNKNCYEVKK